ncbi:nSTAND1 domain-containing NTPase [Micromonospora mangrovi]|uniref:HTH cro/C1-type domain-containing protein n=1 Tax=Micromonospora sp. CCTCC AA 2012012 TaxID=3111921 RepID=A0AAU7MAT7_9ACTN
MPHVNQSSSDAVDPAQLGGRADFAAALTGLRERSGLTVRQVAVRAGAHSASSTIGDWFAGRGLPSVASQDLFVKVLGICGVRPDEIDAWLVAWRRVRRGPGRRAEGMEPYRGLASFQPDDARWFFGRDRSTAQLVEAVVALHEAGGGLLLVVGASGSGKSSLLRAGLIASLRSMNPETATPGPISSHPARRDEWTIELMTPGPTPLADLAPRAARIGNGGGPALLVVDQAEELFTTDAAPDPGPFVDELAALSSAVVVVGIRADFYGHALRFPPLLEAAQHRQITVGPLSAEELRAVIIGPAHRAGVEIEDGLVELLLGDLAVTAETDQPETGVLPLLSHALYATWCHDRGRRLTCLGYREVGRVAGGVAATATRVYDQLDPAQQRLARRLFLSLVHVGADTPDTRRVVSPTELLGDFGTTAPEAERIIDVFIEHRLITADTMTVQISHEALLTAWPTLRNWLAADRAGLLLRQQLAAASTTWHAEHREPALLYAGPRLAAAQGWASQHPDEVSPLMREYLDAGARHERRRTRRLYQAAATLTVLALATCVLAGYAFQERATANNQRRLAVVQRNEAVSRQLAGRADRMRSRDVALARQFALAAYQTAPTAEARSSLLDAAATPTVTRLAGFSNAAQAVSYSPARRLLAAGGADRAVQLWDVSTAPAPTAVGSPLTGFSGTLYAVAFHPGGRILAAAGADRTVHLWGLDDATHPRPLAPLSGPASTIYALAFSPDGRFLAAGSADHRLWLWDINESGVARPLPPLDGADDAIQAVAFSPDGALLAAGSADRRVHLWTIAEDHRPTVLTTLSGHGGKVLAVAFSPDGKLLASGSGDQSIRLWDLADPHRPVLRGSPLTGPSSWVNTITFSPDGRILAIGSSDKTITLVQVATARILQNLPHPAPVTALAFGADGSALASSSTDGYIRYWALPGPVLTGATGAVFSASFSPDGSMLVSAGRDETLQLWNTGDPRRPAPLTGPLRRPAGSDGYAGTAVISPDGRTIAVGSRTGAVELWDVSQPRRPTRLGPPLLAAGALIETLAFSADSTLLAAGGDDSQVHLWTLTDRDNPRLTATIPSGEALVLSVAFNRRQPLLAVADTEGRVRLFDVTTPSRPIQLGNPLTPFSGYAYSVAFSPDGTLLAAGSADKTVRLWTVTEPDHPTPLPQPLLGPTSYVYWIAFSPDGRSIAAASTDGTIWLWNVTDPRRPAVVAALAHADEAFYVVNFSPDGHTLAAGGAENTVQFWELDTERLRDDICATVGAPVTTDEWAQFAGGVPYSPPC